MATYTARIELIGIANEAEKSARYQRLYEAMDQLKITHLRQPTGEYTLTGADMPTEKMAEMLRRVIYAIHTPNSGTVEKGEIAKW